MMPTTKHDKILLINHAIAYFKSLNKTQKHMSQVLDIKESRISELKRGEGVMSPNLVDQIIKVCGAPRRNPGRFEFAEMYDSFEDFRASFQSISENRYMCRLIDIFKIEGNRTELINNCFHLNDDNSSTGMKATLSDIDSLVRSDEFTSVCEQYVAWLSSPNGPSFNQWTNVVMPIEKWKTCEAPKPILRVNNFGVLDISVFHALYLLWLLVSRCPGFYLTEVSSYNLQPEIDVEPVILTGHKVLVLSNRLDKLSLNEPIVQLFGKHNNYRNIDNYDNNFRFTKEIDILGKPDHWEEVQYEVYLSENMNYHLVVHLAPNSIHSHPDWGKYGDYAETMDKTTYVVHVESNDRFIVISNINSLDLFRFVEEARKWCGLPEDNLLDLKRKIALAGGYIPGAKLLV